MLTVKEITTDSDIVAEIAIAKFDYLSANLKQPEILLLSSAAYNKLLNHIKSVSAVGFINNITRYDDMLVAILVNSEYKEQLLISVAG